MFDDETNLEQEDTMFGDDDLDLDWDDDTDEDEENQPVEEQDDGLTVKYNGKETKVAKDDIPTYVQKGMNYDHIKAELESLQAGNAYRVLKKQADKEGMSVEQYAKYMLDKEDADVLSDMESEVRKENPNLPNSIIKELAEARAAKKANNAKAEQNTAAEKAWAEALSEYPDMTRDSIPQEVLEAVAGGKSPLIALKNYEIAQLRAKEKQSSIEQRNIKNKEKSTGSMRGDSADGDDQFLAGLFGKG
jgi:hypothetical protein